MQRLAAGVKTQCALVFCNMDMQTDVWIGDADIGTLASAFTELIDNSIFDFVGYELGMTELLREYH